MPGFTPNLNLYKPGGGSTGLITPDEVVDIDRINANSDLIDAWAGTINADRTDLRARDGMVKIKPTAVAGGTLQPNGSVSVSSGDTVRLDGVFTTSFRRYLMVGTWEASGGVNGAGVRLCAAGVPSTVNYDAQSLTANGSSVLGGFTAAGPWFPGVGIAGNSHSAEYLFINPGHPQATFWQSQTGTSPAGISVYSAQHVVSTAYDGVQLELSTKGGGRAFTSGEFAVYGLA